MTRILISAVVSCALSGLLGYLLLPVLRALKAGQSIRELGPTWHNNKAGTPMMGGLMFIFALIICLLIALINQMLILCGKGRIPFTEDEIYQTVSYIALGVIALWNWWKNNSFTDKAQQADIIISPQG